MTGRASASGTEIREVDGIGMVTETGTVAKGRETAIETVVNEIGRNGRLIGSVRGIGTGTGIGETIRSGRGEGMTRIGRMRPRQVHQERWMGFQADLSQDIAVGRRRDLVSAEEALMTTRTGRLNEVRERKALIVMNVDVGAVPRRIRVTIGGRGSVNYRKLTRRMQIAGGQVSKRLNDALANGPRLAIHAPA